MNKFDLREIERSFFNYDNDGCDSSAQVWEKRREEWAQFKKHLLITTDRATEVLEEMPKLVIEGGEECCMKEAVEPKAEGTWLPNNGGCCPVADGILFSVKYRNFLTRHNLLRGSGYCNEWAISHEDYDILEYRVGGTEGFGSEEVEDEVKEKQEEKKTDGWIAFEGKTGVDRSPVDGDVRTEIRRRDGRVIEAARSCQWRWSKQNINSDIVAYRIVRE